MKKIAKTARKTATKTTKNRVPKKPRYNYHTPISTLEKEYGFKSDLPPDTKIGDALKKLGKHTAAWLLPR